MFKWSCFGVAVIFLAATSWMLNDIRLEVRRAGEITLTTAQTVNEHLPTIVDRSKQITGVVAEHLPDIVAKARTTTDTLAAVAQDLRHVREWFGFKKAAGEPDVMAYADGLLEKVKASGGTIGLKNPLPGSKGLVKSVSAEQWVAGAHTEAKLLNLGGVSKKTMATQLAKNKFQFFWYIQVRGEEPVRLLDWLKANPPPTRELWSGEK
jgi:hypothetical protein